MPMKEDNETNCLHAAISGSSKFIREIISLMETYRPESQPKKHPFEARESNAGNTPLHLAIKNVTTAHLQGLWKYLHPETLKFLGGPDNAKADQWASENDDGRALSIVETLIMSHETALTTRNKEGRTPYQERITRLDSKWNKIHPSDAK
ncbi:Alpha-glucosidase [Fusarium oxysporum f. sp. albedinis]|nr:Alpha-glucosidase [Fusarium oxysporum f. sp. albedinis]